MSFFNNFKNYASSFTLLPIFQPCSFSSISFYGSQTGFNISPRGNNSMILIAHSVHTTHSGGKIKYSTNFMNFLSLSSAYPIYFCHHRGLKSSRYIFRSYTPRITIMSFSTSYFIPIVFTEWNVI